MTTQRHLVRRLMLMTGGLVFAAAIALVGAAQQAGTAAAQAEAARVAIDQDDIGGVVTSASGPEAGVWVIAETSDLPTRYRKIVVTDDRGRFVVPDLPSATYKVWVRGYGLVDSQPVTSVRGRPLALTATPAPDARAAAQIYPADYWYSLLQIPPKDAFPMTVAPFVQYGRGGEPQVAAGGRGGAAAAGRGAGGGGGRGAQGTVVQDQVQWVQTVKGCVICHQMGNKATREISPALGKFDSSIAAWDYRIRVGQNSNGGINGVSALGSERALSMFADWTDRIAAGETPAAPPRPQGLERNLVITEWDFASTTAFVHDLIASDKNNPTVNAKGPVWATEWSHNTIEMLDPGTHITASMKIPLQNEKERQQLQAALTMQKPSPVWGDEAIWEETQSAQHVAVDSRGNVWFNARNKLGSGPAYCKTGSDNPFAKYDPIDQAGKELNFYDPKTGKFTLLDTCFGSSHIIIGNDPDETIYASSGRLGWVKTRTYLETRDIQKSTGWCPTILDTNGDGKIGAYTRPNEPSDPSLDRMVQAPGYGVSFNPVDRSVWWAVQAYPGAIVRVQPGANPPETCLTEIYNPPFKNPAAPGVMGSQPRGIDVDRNGLVWTGLAATGHLASFDRSKCKVLNGPTATGPHCAEGWTLYPTPSPKFKGVGNDDINAGFLYYNWVDRYDTFGMGANIPLAMGTGSDSLFALNPTTKQWVILRVPYPLGFYTRGLDGRIDDPNAGWKGRGLWGANESRVSWHNEAGKGATSYVAQFQLRPDPLAK